MDSLRGQLLIAAPQLVDAFRRTVVLVLEHDEDGAMGLVLNRPTQTEVVEAVPSLAEMTAYGDVLHAGGPVEPTAILALGDFEDPAQAGSTVTGTLGLLDPDRPAPALKRLRVFAGYAGWASGQLDAEVAEKAWVIAPAAHDDPFIDGDLWPVVLQRMGGSYALMATMPADPSMN